MLVQGQADLADIRLARESPRSLPGRLYGRQQQRNENTDDGNYHQEFNQRVKASLTLNGVEVWWTKSDSQGNLVAKFDVDSVKAIVKVPSATLELTGEVELLDEGIAYAFSGTDTVPVVDNGGKK